MMMTGIKLNIFSLLRTFIHSNIKQKKFYPLGGRILEFGIKNKTNFYKKL
jgi:hypothetical protein